MNVVQKVLETTTWQRPCLLGDTQRPKKEDLRPTVLVTQLNKWDRHTERGHRAAGRGQRTAGQWSDDRPARLELGPGKLGLLSADIQAPKVGSLRFWASDPG